MNLFDFTCQITKLTYSVTPMNFQSNVFEFVFHTVSLQAFCSLLFPLAPQAKMSIDFTMPAKKLSNEKSQEVNLVISQTNFFL